MRSVSRSQSSRNSKTLSRHFGVELGDPVFLDLRLVLDPELLLDGDLDRQAVAVPAALAVAVEAAHRLEAREDVLEHARQHVVGAGPAVGGRRALVEDVRRRALAAAQRLVVDVELAPALEDLLLELREVDLFGQGTMRHGHVSLGGALGSNPDADGMDLRGGGGRPGAVHRAAAARGLRDPRRGQPPGRQHARRELHAGGRARRPRGRAARPARASRASSGTASLLVAGGHVARARSRAGSAASGPGSTPSTAAIC